LWISSGVKAQNDVYCAEKTDDTCDPTTARKGVQPKDPVSGFWPTRTIAVVFSPKIAKNNKLVEAARKAIGPVGSESGYNFYECSDEGKIAKKKFPYIYFDDLRVVDTVLPEDCR
jgi:hypothetical protein